MSHNTSITIDDNLKERLASLSLCVLAYDQVSVSETPGFFKGRVNLFAENLRNEYEKPGRVTDIPAIQSWRDAFKKIGMDPSRYRPSSEALIRRVLQNKPLYWINTAVDVNNFLSMYYGLPFGIYDRDQIRGTITCRPGKPDESFEGLNGRTISCTDKLILADDQGPFGSPVVDSTRTRITDQSQNLLHVIYLPPDFRQDPEVLIGSVGKMFTQLNGGQVSFHAVIR
ncbi:MAG: hypothetical protein H0Z33_15970 [Bacillaceae bacterium]|nr:hypothetical protein [Bacillaceae bacterium]